MPDRIFAALEAGRNLSACWRVMSTEGIGESPVQHRSRAAATRTPDAAFPAAPGAPEAASLADVIERCFAAFGRQLGLPLVVRVVRRCRRELDISSGPAAPANVERLARERLHVLAASLDEELPVGGA